MALTSSTHIGSISIHRNDEQRALLLRKDGVDDILTFTPIEYQILLCFLTSEEELLTDRVLVERVYGYSDITSIRRTFEKHIENIRSKISPSGLELRRVYRLGYLLLEKGVEEPIQTFEV